MHAMHAACLKGWAEYSAGCLKEGLELVVGASYTI